MLLPLQASAVRSARGPGPRRRCARSAALGAGNGSTALDDISNPPRLDLVPRPHHQREFRRVSACRRPALLSRESVDVAVSHSLGCLPDQRPEAIRLCLLMLVYERVFQNGTKILDRPNDDREDKEDPERLTQTHLEATFVNQSFREAAPNRFFPRRFRADHGLRESTQTALLSRRFA